MSILDNRGFSARRLCDFIFPFDFDVVQNKDVKLEDRLSVAVVVVPNFILKLSSPTTFSGGTVLACCGHLNLGNGAITGAEVCATEHAIHSFIWRDTRYELDFLSRRRCPVVHLLRALVSVSNRNVSSTCSVGDKILELARCAIVPGAMQEALRWFCNRSQRCKTE